MVGVWERCRERVCFGEVGCEQVCEMSEGGDG